MSEPIARSWRITRRTLGASVLGAFGLAAVQTWPRWAFWSSNGSELEALAALPQADALRALGSRLIRSPSPPNAVATSLLERLAGGYDSAVARDRAEGRLMAVDGWLVPETQALAGLWLASAAGT